jgi:hypothetical protein
MTPVTDTKPKIVTERINVGRHLWEDPCPGEICGGMLPRRSYWYNEVGGFYEVLFTAEQMNTVMFECSMSPELKAMSADEAWAESLVYFTDVEKWDDPEYGRLNFWEEAITESFTSEDFDDLPRNATIIRTEAKYLGGGRFKMDILDAEFYGGDDDRSSFYCDDPDY